MIPLNYLSKPLILLLLLFSVIGIAQDVQERSIVTADSLWGKEIIKLPVEWAPNMTIKGFEELRFAPGWSTPESDQFWTYVLAWQVQAPSPLAINEIELNLENYFDGLMKPNHWATTFPDPIVLLTTNKDQINTPSFYGKMKYFDGFHTGKVITTNIRGEQFFCEETNKTIVLFKISPKKFNHPVWEELATIKKKSSTCY